MQMLDDLSRDIWRALQAEMLTDDDAQKLAEAIHVRRAVARARLSVETSLKPAACSSDVVAFFDSVVNWMQQPRHVRTNLSWDHTTEFYLYLS